MPRRFTRTDNWEFGAGPGPADDESREPKSRKRRLATTLVFTTIFFAGGSLAAIAGDELSSQLGSDSALQADASAPDNATGAEATAGAPDGTATPDADAQATSDATADAAAPEAAAPEAAAPDATAPDATAPDAGATAAAPDDTAADASADSLTPDHSAASAPAGTDAHATPAAIKRSAVVKARLHRAHLRKILLPKIKKAPPPEIEGPADAATIWLNAQLPDPTPPALRLSRKFASNLKIAAKGNGVDWAVMLGILRARGATGHTPADRVTLRKLAARLGSYGPTKGDWATIVSYSGDTEFADRAAALARYDRAVGLNALINGLEAAKHSIANRLLSDPQVSIYEGGRNDIVQDKVDVRVLAVIAYLRESFGQVTVSCLISGHRLYARPGVISAHIYGHAVDIAGLGGTSILGHQEPGGVTERAVRDLLMLPSEVMPRQIISLLGMGGASFPLADHANHIHIGF